MREQVLALAPEGGAEHFARNLYFDRVFGRESVKVMPGEYCVTDDDMGLVTVLGSCVSACIRDPGGKLGGMNHFMLPENSGNAERGVSARYGAYAMELLINHLLKMGARRERLEAKVFGGGRVMESLAGSRVGDRNAAFVRGYLKLEGIRIVAEDLLDVYPRKVYFFPQTGRVMVKRLVHLGNDTLIKREREYAERLKHAPAGDVELF